MKEIRDDVGSYVRKLRKGHGYSQDKLASLTGIYQHEISRIELGKTRPSANKAKRLGEALGVGEDGLFTPEM